MLNSRFGYVAVSWASHDAKIFTDDMNRLGQQLAIEVSKTSALDVDQNVSIGQGISIS
jgi:hypothetical protein